MENVGALTFRGLDAVLGSLAEIGYNAEWQDIRASDMGAPHRRERIWIVAYADDSGKWRNERESEIEADAMADTGLQRQTEHEKQTARVEQCGENVPGNYGERCKEQYNRIAEGEGNFNRCNDRRKTEHSGWSIEPDMGRLAHGLPGRVDRLKGLGNAIVPQIAELLFNRIKPLL